MAYFHEGGVGNVPGTDDRHPDEIAAARAADEARNALLDEVIGRLQRMKLPTPWLNPDWKGR